MTTQGSVYVGHDYSGKQMYTRAHAHISHIHYWYELYTEYKGIAYMPEYTLISKYCYFKASGSTRCKMLYGCMQITTQV